MSRTFQHVKMIPEMTVLENVAFFTFNGAEREQINARRGTPINWAWHYISVLRP
ncbi:hypothetical protein LP417_24180 [Polaromonas sp. P1-6]|nr:hypothetical protein LP417_24180 [Polaromonas sp. P1-6]